MAPKVLAAILLLALAGCSNSNNPSGTSFFTASVDGVAWTAGSASTAVGSVNSPAGTYTITMTQPGTNPSTIVLTLRNIAKTTTYFLGVGATNFGGQAVFSDATSGWSTPNTGDDGSIQITTLSSSRIAGMFNFDATPLTGAATGTKHVTGGQFDLPIVAGGLGPGDALGKSLSATIDTLFWNGATADGALSNGIFVAHADGAMNGVGNVSMTLNGVCTAGDYALSTTAPTRSLSVSDLTGTKVWSSASAGGAGTITISSVTPTLIKGSFISVTVAPSFGSATGNRTLTNGSFTLGQQTPPTCAPAGQ